VEANVAGVCVCVYVCVCIYIHTYMYAYKRLMSQAFARCLETHCIKRMGTFDSDAWSLKAERLLCSSFFDTAGEDVSDVRVSPLSFFFFSFSPLSFFFLFFLLLWRVRSACVTPLSFFF